MPNVTVAKRRDRLVYFRISEEEFEQILKACDSKGARSVSDLARAAVLEFIKPAKTESGQQLSETLNSLSTVLDEINQSVRQLVSNARPSLEIAGVHVAAGQGQPAQSAVDDSTESS
jgi:hypothetical protein